MTFELLFGIGLIAIGAFSSGSFSIPFGKTRNWAWENYWLIYSLFAYVIVPLVACYVFCPGFMNVLSGVPAQTLGWIFLLGIIYGICNLTFGLSLRYLGLSLGFSLSLGLMMILGTIIPPAIDAIPEAKKLFVEAMEHDRETYKKLGEILAASHEKELTQAGKDPKDAQKAAKKMANEDARYVLSNACDTKIVMTMNVRSLYNFFALRCCERAQWEIRALATEMLRLVKGVSPVLFKNAGPACVRGKCAEGGMSCGKAAQIRGKFANL